MKPIRLLLLLAGLIGLSLSVLKAHEEPTSYIDLTLESSGATATITASTIDLSHSFPDMQPDMLLDQPTVDARAAELFALIQKGLQVSSNSVEFTGQLEEISVIAERGDLHFEIHYPWTAAPDSLELECKLFTYDPNHKTFLNIYRSDEVIRQEVFTTDHQHAKFATGTVQGILPVIWEFTIQGIHHIFIGPDHILFVIGLMLLGGKMGQLLKIVTAFTVAHSVTLCLATFRIVTPPANIIEPIIALSIVFVGIHALLGRSSNDPRLLFAFLFGLIHGFGFANVLQEMMLPRQALGWSLFAFNFGIELGQACIVLAIVPILALLRRYSELLSERVITSGALTVTTAGAFWFFQRII